MSSAERLGVTNDTSLTSDMSPKRTTFHSVPDSDGPAFQVVVAARPSLHLSKKFGNTFEQMLQSAGLCCVFGFLPEHQAFFHG